MWFSKRKERKSSPMTDAAARFISAGIVSTQTKIVLRLQALESRCSLWQKKFLLMLFCVISTALLLYILTGALTGKQHLTRNNHSILNGHIPPSAQPPPLLLFKDSIKVPRAY